MTANATATPAAPPVDFQPIAKELGLMHATLSQADAKARWRFAMKIFVARANAPKRGKEFDAAVGAECAAAVGRDKPYSPQWVRLHCSAAGKFASEPSTPEEAYAFLATLNGHKSRTGAKKPAKQAKQNYTPDELLAKVAAWARRAIVDGSCTISAVEQAARDGIARAAKKPGKPAVRAAARSALATN